MQIRRMRNSTGMQFILRTVIILLCTMLPSADVFSIPVEAGFTAGMAVRNPDRVDAGLKKLRTSIDSETYSLTDFRSRRSYAVYDLYIYFLDSLAKNHSIGLFIGNQEVPYYDLREYRSDGFIHDLHFKFYAPYFLIQYRHERRARFLPFFRRWNSELGVGYGLVLNPEFQVHGLQYYDTDADSWDSLQTGSFGNIIRMEASLSRKYSRYLRFRAGLRLSYTAMGGFSGDINGSRGTFFETANNEIMPLSLTSWNLIHLLHESPFFPTTAVPPAYFKDRMVYTNQAEEFFISASVDTR